MSFSPLLRLCLWIACVGPQNSSNKKESACASRAHRVTVSMGAEEPTPANSICTDWCCSLNPLISAPLTCVSCVPSFSPVPMRHTSGSLEAMMEVVGTSFLEICTEGPFSHEGRFGGERVGRRWRRPSPPDVQDRLQSPAVTVFGVFTAVTWHVEIAPVVSAGREGHWSSGDWFWSSGSSWKATCMEFLQDCELGVSTATSNREGSA